MDIPKNLGGARLGAAVERSEHRAEPDLADPGLPDLPSRGRDGRLVQRDDGPPVALVAALDHEDRPPHDPGEPVGPVAERRQRSAGGQPDPHRGHPFEAGPGEDGVREVRRPDHHAGDVPDLRPATEHAVKRRHHAGRDVLGGPGLDLGEHPPAAHEDRVGVGPADIDPDAVGKPRFSHSKPGDCHRAARGAGGAERPGNGLKALTRRAA